jgi:hypothetical protein
MAKDGTNLASSVCTSLVGTKTVNAARAFKHGVVTVLELRFTDTSTVFIKFASNDGLEIGGTSDYGTGTKVNF